MSGSTHLHHETRHCLDELEQARSQLLVFAKDISSIYQRERSQARRLETMMETLRDDYLAMVQTLALVVEAKDEYTRYHLERCQEYGMALAAEVIPHLSGPSLQYGFLLHDVGKIGIPESILTKPGPLDPGERVVMQMHPLIGVQLVEPMKRVVDDVTMEVIRSHHERFDGNGYPDHLKGDEIPVAARVFSVVDAFDAMTTDRPYRRGMSLDAAVARIREGAGSQFDPDIVDAFCVMVHREEMLVSSF